MPLQSSSSPQRREVTYAGSLRMPSLATWIYTLGEIIAIASKVWLSPCQIYSIGGTA